jgi:hypothetical protein
MATTFVPHNGLLPMVTLALEGFPAFASGQSTSSGRSTIARRFN